MPIAGKEKRALKIAFVITELEIGGAERCLANLVLRLDRQRFDAQVVVLAPRPNPTKDMLVRMLEAELIPIHFLGATSILDTWSVYRQLRDELHEQRPDIVQSFLFHANVLGAYAAKAAKVAKVVTAIRVADPSRWRRIVERRATRLVDRVVCVSQSVANHAHRDTRIPSGKIVVIPNGVNLGALSNPMAPNPLRPLIQPGKKILTVIGRLHPQKGIDWLLSALPPLFQIDPDVEVVIVGEGPSEGELKQLAGRLGVSRRVHFLGWRNDVPAILHSSDLFVLPSRWEGMANALLEAMAVGLPVISTRVEGVDELLGRGDSKQTVAFGDTQALVDGIASILSDPLRSKELRMANQERVAAFSLERMVEEFQMLYDGLFRSPQQARNIL